MRSQVVDCKDAAKNTMYGDIRRQIIDVSAVSASVLLRRIASIPGHLRPTQIVNVEVIGLWLSDQDAGRELGKLDAAFGAKQREAK